MSSLLQKRFPIGNFKYGNSYSEKEINGLVKDIQKLPKLLKKTLKKLSGEELDTPYRPGGWTVRQVIHHLADSHMNAYIRMKWAVTEATPTIKPYEEGLWAELWDGKNGHHKLSLNLLTALHKRWTVFLKNLDAAAFERGYFSPHAGRVLSLAEALALYAWHGKHHVSHIKLLTGWEPKPFDFEHDAAAQSTAAAASATDAPKKRGPKPGSKKAKTVEPAAAEPKRKRRTKEEMAAAKAEMVAQPKRTYRSKEEIAIDKARLAVEKAARPPIDRVAQMAKARAARKANIAAESSQKPVDKPAKIKAAKKEAPVRKRRSSEEVAAEKAANAARPKLTNAEVLALARAARMAKIAAEGPKSTKIKAVKKEKAAAEPTVRKRRTSEEVAAEKAEKAARPKLTPAEQMAKARAARGTKNEAAGLPKKQYRTSEEVAAEKAEKAARPKLSPIELMAKARAARAANIAARLAAEGHEPKPEKTLAAAPRKFRTAEEIAAENAEKAARPKLDRVALMAKARAARAANIAARAAGDAPKTNNPPADN